MINRLGYSLSPWAASALLLKKYPQFDISLTEIRPGPPVGRPLEAEISGFDDAASETAALRLMEFLKTVPGVTTIDSGLKKPVLLQEPTVLGVSHEGQVRVQDDG